MNQTKKLTVSAMVAALCVAILALTGVVPRITLGLTALAGLFPAIVVIVCGYGWALGTSVTVVLLGLLLLPDKTAVLWFACFFGHYPLWKAWFEGLQNRKSNPGLGWALKLAGFAVCLVVLWFFFQTAFFAAIPMELESTMLSMLLVLGLTVCFIVYDIAFSILIGFFRLKILPKLK